MNKLGAIRSQLSHLRRRRQSVRWLTGLLPLGTAVLWGLAGVFLLDWLFQRSMDVTQRVVVLAIGAAGVLWAFNRFTLPWFGVREDDLEMALWVEKQQGIDSDLVAALQFESPAADQWGSRQLENAVIDYVAEFGRGLNVLQGLRLDQLARRGWVFALSLLLLGGAAVAFPDYSRVFFNRLALGHKHYPSRTQIEQVVVNHLVVLDRLRDDSQPQDAKSPESRPVAIAVRCAGELPAEGSAQLTAIAGGQRRELELKPLPAAERLARLHEAERGLQELVTGAEEFVSGSRLLEIVGLAHLDAPEAADKLLAPQVPLSVLKESLAGLQQAAELLKNNRETSNVFVGEMPRMFASVRYKLFFGDAWTDPARILQIDLPLVQTRFTATPPDYARGAKNAGPEQGDRHLAVLEGSVIAAGIECVNKNLGEAWLVVRGEPNHPAQQYPLKQGANGRQWSLAAEGTPFAPVTRSFAYEIQVVDEDGLYLPEPLSGRVVLREDRGPAVNLAVADRVWLPTAKPLLRYTVRDDYGVDRLLLHVRCEHLLGGYSTGTFEVRPAGQPLLGNTPVQEKYPLSLASLALQWENRVDGAPQRPVLAKGDRLELTLEAFDYRGSAPGRGAKSDPVALPIGQQDDVLTLVDRDLGNAEEKTTITIDTQTGIGDSP